MLTVSDQRGFLSLRSCKQDGVSAWRWHAMILPNVRDIFYHFCAARCSSISRQLSSAPLPGLSPFSTGYGPVSCASLIFFFHHSVVTRLYTRLSYNYRPDSRHALTSAKAHLVSYATLTVVWLGMHLNVTQLRG